MSYDVIIIGAGHNGLTTAIQLGKKRKKVVVLEKREDVGGLAASREFHPGYSTNGLLHDTSCVRGSLIEKMKLKNYGLVTTSGRPSVTILSKNNEAITLSSDDKNSFDSIAKYSKNDAQAYLDYRQFIQKISPFISSLLDEQQPDLTNLNYGDYWQLIKKGISFKRLGKKTMNEFLKVGPMSLADFLNQRFETEFLKAGMTIPAILGTFTGPWSSYSTLNLLLWECTSKENIYGGASSLIGALEKAAINVGIVIKCESEVSRILLKDSEIVSGVRLQNGEEIEATVVSASCSPKETFLKLLISKEIGPELDSSISHLRSRGTTAQLSLALNKKIQWKAALESPVEFVRTGNTIDEVERAFDAIKYNNFSENPVLDIHIPTESNNKLAPDGHEVVSILASFAPYRLNGGWTESSKIELGNRIIKTLSEYTIGLEGSIVGKEILTPVDIEEQYGISGGNIFHVEHAVDQLISRPVPACAQYETPIKGLFLCGSGSHPGGGLTCVPGVLASQVILAKM